MEIAEIAQLDLSLLSIHTTTTTTPHSQSL